MVNKTKGTIMTDQKKVERQKYMKTGKLVTMYHGKKHIVHVDEALVDCHKKCGWRLKK